MANILANICSFDFMFLIWSDKHHRKTPLTLWCEAFSAWELYCRIPLLHVILFNNNLNTQTSAQDQCNRTTTLGFHLYFTEENTLIFTYFHPRSFSLVGVCGQTSVQSCLAGIVCIFYFLCLPHIIKHQERVLHLFRHNVWICKMKHDFQT